jgi:protein SCO1/2
MLELRRFMPVPSFNLVDQHNQAITPDRMQGKWTIIFFGYTHCPDYCPTTLSALSGALRRLRTDNPKLDGRIQVIFVSLDPFRDTSAVLTDYLAYFDPSFIGATGAPSDLKRFTTLLGVNYDYEDAVSGTPAGGTKIRPAGDYVVDHSADFYVFDDHARLLTWVEPPHTVTRVTSILKSILQD